MTTYITQGQLQEAILVTYDRLNERISAMAEANQADIDQLTADVQGVVTTVQQVAADVATARSTLQAEIDQLAGQGVDVSNLQAADQQLKDAVSPLDSAVNDLGNLKPTPPPAP
jgi:deoxyribodipyrimidine photolyase-like uncharacterized protein